MRILFLDFDGVLNDVNYLMDYDERYDFLSHNGPLDRFELCTQLDTIKVGRLNEIVDETGCYIVLSTAWREYGIESCKNMLMMRGFRYPHRIIDVTPSGFDRHRIGEIILWRVLNDVENDLTSYVMLDDDMTDKAVIRLGENHTVQTYMSVKGFKEAGLTEEKKEEVINKLIGDSY